MAEETTDKSIVVWHPNSFNPNARELTSLCLLHDQVVSCTNIHPNTMKSFFEIKSLFEESLELETEWDVRPNIDFQKDLLKLQREKVITVVVFESLRAEWAEWDEAEANDMTDLLSIWHKKETESKQNPSGRLLHIFQGGDSITAYIFSKIHNYPLVSDDADLLDSVNKVELAHAISEVLAQSAISQLALPNFKAAHVEDILEARTELKDELLEFRAGILKLTWLLHQQVQNKNDLEQIRQEADTLTNTIIKGSLLSLENRMRQHKKKTIRRMLFGTGKVLVQATKLFLPSGAAEKMISGGKGLLQLATEIDSAKPPEDQIATYLYKLKGKLKI